MSSSDRDNYGTVLSYAVAEQDNEITFTDYNGFVLAVKGNNNNRLANVRFADELINALIFSACARPQSDHGCDRERRSLELSLRVVVVQPRAMECQQERGDCGPWRRACNGEKGPG